MKKHNYTKHILIHLLLCAICISAVACAPQDGTVSEGTSSADVSSAESDISAEDTESKEDEMMTEHKKSNLHGHTYRCGHATGTDEQYVTAAISAGYDLMAFTDHVMLPWTTSVNGVRGAYSESTGYYASVRELREKYKGKIDILLGYECEWNEGFRAYYTALLETGTVDFLSLGNHYLSYDFETGRFTDPNSDTSYSGSIQYVRDYVQSSIDAINSGLFKVFVHPDYFMGWYNDWNDETEQLVRQMCIAAKEKGVALEINQGCFIAETPEKYADKYYGGVPRYRYPYDKFWDIVAEVGNTVVTGLDAHSPDYYGYTGARAQALALAASKGITVTEDLGITYAKQNASAAKATVTVIGGTGSAKLIAFGATEITAIPEDGMIFDSWTVNGVYDGTLPDSFCYVNFDGEDKIYAATFKPFTEYDKIFDSAITKGENIIGALTWHSSLSSVTVEHGAKNSRGVAFNIADDTQDGVMTLTAEIPFNVNRIAISAAMGQGNDTKMTVSIGGKVIVEDYALTNQNKEYAFECGGLTGEVKITFSSSVKGKKSYIRGVKIY